MYSVIRVFLRAPSRSLPGFELSVPVGRKRKMQLLRTRLCAFPDVGLFSKAVGVNGAEQRRSLLATFLPPPCMLSVQLIRNRFGPKESINASSNYSVVDVWWGGGQAANLIHLVFRRVG